jgi:hypothetical protein
MLGTMRESLGPAPEMPVPELWEDSEPPLTFVQNLRLIAGGELGATEGCRSYHGDLRSLGIKLNMPLEQDL